MAATWSLPAILPRQAREQIYQDEVRRRAKPTSIVWQENALTSDSAGSAPSNISVIQLWLDRELDLAQMRNFDTNWDGMEAEAPDPTIIKRAGYFLRLLQERDPTDPPMRVAISGDGSVAFEWARENRFVQAEISDTTEVEWLIATPGSATKFEVEQLTDRFTSAEAREQAWQPAPSIVEDASFVSER